MFLDDEYRDLYTAKIYQRGFVYSIYREPETERNVVTTVGNTHRGWPELSINSSFLSTEDLIGLLEHVVAWWDEKGEPQLGLVPECYTYGVPVQLRVDVATGEDPAWTRQLNGYYCIDGFMPIVYQIVYPDSEHTLPGEDGYHDDKHQTFMTSRKH